VVVVQLRHRHLHRLCLPKGSENEWAEVEVVRGSEWCQSQRAREAIGRKATKLPESSGAMIGKARTKTTRDLDLEIDRDHDLRSLRESNHNHCSRKTERERARVNDFEAKLRRELAVKGSRKGRKVQRIEQDSNTLPLGGGAGLSAGAGASAYA